jgi:uncharacterized NAD(P)/FAD-binding protein YdhS
MAYIAIMIDPMRNVIVIVGGGFSGTVLAVKLLMERHATATDVFLAERGADMGRGIAYAKSRFPFLLNVPAGRLSVDAQDPLQFLRFAQAQLPAAGAEDFLPRSMYGDYLQDLLARAERDPPPGVRFQRILDEVTDVKRAAGSGLAVHFARRESVVAGIVVLASGNPPASWLPWTDSLQDHPAVRENPWDLPPKVSADQSVLIIGNGLTMADVAFALSLDPKRTPLMHTVSRRGLLPQPQSEFGSISLDAVTDRILSCAQSTRELLDAVRRLARHVEQRGGDWREAITFMRTLAPKVWAELPDRERARFLRHVQPHWDVHRHRLPPQIAEHIGTLRRAGKLHVHAGRVRAAVAEGERLRVSWQPRGNGGTQSLLADYIVNASGPDYSLERSREPLIHSLRSQGMIAADPLRLGIRTGLHGACLDSFGQQSARLYYLGPMLRADHWEATAATELRDHALKLARHLARGASG